MELRSTIYEGAALLLMVGSAACFYQMMSFLAAEDYVAGILALAAGFVVIRAGVELGKLAIVVRREES